MKWTFYAEGLVVSLTVMSCRIAIDHSQFYSPLKHREKCEVQQRLVTS